MATDITTIDNAATPARFANPLQQIGGAIRQPAVRRSLPLILLVGLVASAALAWMLLATPPQRTLFSSLADADKASVTETLAQADIDAHVDGATGAVTVAEDDYHRARMLLATEGLPKAAPGGYAILDQLPMGVSRAVEGERLRQARETELARSIEEIDAVAEARVHLAMPEASVFVRDSAQPSASVIVKLEAGRSLGEAQVRSVVNLVASSVPGMRPDAVTVIDGMGALLTRAGGGDSGVSLGDERIDFQRRLEDKYRQQLSQLLTPLIGAGNFTAEVQAEVDLDETQATRETIDKEGALLAEQGSWTNDAGGAMPGGIPGALSNTPPPATEVRAGEDAPQNAAAAATAQQAAAAKQADSFARRFDVGKEVSVTRATPGSVKRLSVAVVVREAPGGKARTQAEMKQLTDLVRAAVGYDEGRRDQVAVISRGFAGAEELAPAPWYEAGWVPMVARNLTALVIALLVLLLGVRPLAKGLMKKREEATPPALAGPAGEDGDVPGRREPVSIAMLDGARSYDDKVALVRDFTRDNPARAALAVRDMIRTDQPQPAEAR